MVSRRLFLATLAGAAALPAHAHASADPFARRYAQAGQTPAKQTPTMQTPAMSRPTAYSFSFEGLDGGRISLSAYAGVPVLVVNTASLCGYTPQYAGLQTLWTRYHDAGLMMIGVPSNDFGGQEPGGAAEINHTAHDEYKIGFPLTAKSVVTGPQRIGFYRWAALERPADPPRWNFHKYLIGRQGHVVASFASAIDPLDPRVIAAIEQELRSGA